MFAFSTVKALWFTRARRRVGGVAWASLVSA